MTVYFNKLIITLCTITILSLMGCASTPYLQSTNDDLKKHMSPFMYMQSGSYENAVVYVEKWRGAKGESITKGKKLHSEILQNIQASCGYGEKDLIESQLQNSWG